MTRFAINLDPRRWPWPHRYVRRSVHLSEVLPGTVLWEDWKVDPRCISRAQDGRMRLKGFETYELLNPQFKPLCETVVEGCRQSGEWMVFRRHPRMEGVLVNLNQENKDLSSSC